MFLNEKTIKLVGLLYISIMAAACNCKASYMPENYIVKKDDKYMNCQQIIYAINETEFWIKNVNERCARPYVFSKFVPCTPMVKLDAMRNEYTLWDRVDYLKSLYKLRGCDLKTGSINNNTIERQARRIGTQKKLEQNMQKTTSLNSVDASGQQMKYGNNLKVIANIPVNTVAH